MTPPQPPFSVTHRLCQLIPKSLVLRLLLLLPMVLAAACQATQPVMPEQQQQPPQPYTLGPGDKVSVTVYEHENLSGNFTVDDTGRLSLPLVGGIDVRGMSLPELEKTISQRLLASDLLNPKVSTSLLELRPFCILGEVRNPGCFSFIHGLTASRAVALAGGYTYRAVKDQFTITRADGSKITGNSDTPVYSGDLVEVAERFF